MVGADDGATLQNGLPSLFGLRGISSLLQAIQDLLPDAKGSANGKSGKGTVPRDPYRAGKSSHGAPVR